MKKNYFLSILLLLTASWQVQAQGSSLSVPAGAPSALTITAVSGSATSLSLTWTDNSNDETDFQIIYRTQITGSAEIPVTIASTTGGATGGTITYTLTGLSPNTAYYVWVLASKETEASARETEASASCASLDPPTTVLTGARSYSCWTDRVSATTNPTLPAAVGGVGVTSPYKPRETSVYFTDNSDNETEFIIERSSGGSYAEIGRMPAVSGVGQRIYLDNTTQPDTWYSYRVSARNATGVTLPESTGAFFLTLPNPPKPVYGLATFDAIGINTISIYWLEPGGSNPTGFIIELSTDNRNWTRIGTNRVDNRGFVARNLNEGQLYYFRVIAVNSGGESAPSEVLLVQTAKRVAPNAASNLVAKTISTSQIDLSWNLSLQDGITNNRAGHDIYRSSVSATDGYVLIAALVGENDTRYSDKTASQKTKYWYKVITANVQGKSPATNIAVATTLGPPFAPSGLLTNFINDALGNPVVRATWKDNSSDEWGFAIERTTDSTFSKEIVRAELDSNTTAAIITPIEEGVTYYFRVYGLNKYGASAYSPVSKLSVSISGTPNAPYDLKSVATSPTSVSMKWGDDSNKETTFEVERSDNGAAFVKIGTTLRNEITYTDKTTKEKTKYSYRVRAVNAKGNSDYTNVISVTTPASTSGAIEISEEKVLLQIYPNPTADAIKISISESMLKDKGTIIITDKFNRVISKSFLNSNQSEYRLDLSNYPEGTYTLSIQTAKQQITKRIYKF